VDDAALLARIRERDEQALEVLHARFSASVRALALRVTRAERFADEVTQDVFMAIWREPERYDPARGTLAPWLMRLARNKAIDLVRREESVRRRTADVDLTFAEAPDDVHDEVWATLRRERLRASIARLPEDQRRALQLAFLGGLTHVEVAEREGIPLGTAKTRIRTALLRLRADLGSELDEVNGAEARGAHVAAAAADMAKSALIRDAGGLQG
jgi:RNA polymerase sigma-70 factor (ECF subfamily)